MGERTEYTPGTFSWTDLGTSDAEGAKSFYTALFGWEHEDMPMPDGGSYTMLRKGGKTVAALYEAQQGPPNWLAYVTVESADAAAAKAKELGGSAISEPFDVMEVGRMAVLQDPQGAVFAIWEPKSSIGAELVNDPGSMTMTQLFAPDREATERFYSGLFGWRIEQIGEEPYFSIFNGDTLNASMTDVMPDAQAPPYWLVYFTVEDINATAAAIGEHGGQVVLPPLSIGHGNILAARDPQGAHFALFAGEIDP